MAFMRERWGARSGPFLIVSLRMSFLRKDGCAVALRVFPERGADLPRDRTRPPVSDNPVVYEADGRDFGGRSREEAFIGAVNVEQGELRLSHAHPHIPGQANDCSAGDPIEDAEVD